MGRRHTLLTPPLRWPGKMELRLSVTTPDHAHILSTVPGGSESRGALRKMSDLLELMVKRMDMLARLENSSELHRTASVAHLAADR